MYETNLPAILDMIQPSFDHIMYHDNYYSLDDTLPKTNTSSLFKDVQKRNALSSFHHPIFQEDFLENSGKVTKKIHHHHTP